MVVYQPLISDDSIQTKIESAASGQIISHATVLTTHHSPGNGKQCIRNRAFVFPARHPPKSRRQPSIVVSRRIRFNKIHRLELSKCRHLLLPDKKGEIVKKMTIRANGEGVPSDREGLAAMAHALTAQLKELSEIEAQSRNDSPSSNTQCSHSSPTDRDVNTSPTVRLEETFIKTSGIGTNANGDQFEYELALEIHHQSDKDNTLDTPIDSKPISNGSSDFVALKPNSVRKRKSEKGYNAGGKPKLDADTICFVA